MSKVSDPSEIGQPATTILDLNDHVLCEVFKNLNNFDLSVMANVCSAFRQNAQDVFRFRYQFKSFDISIRNYHFLFEPKLEFNHQRLRSVLQSFGNMIKLWNIRFEDNVPVYPLRLMRLIDRYSGEENDEMRLERVIFTADLIPTLRTLLPRVRNLRIDSCEFDTDFDVSQMFSFCSQLRTLLIENQKKFDLRGAHVPIPKLESFALRWSEGIVNGSIVNFLEMNPQLKEIKIEILPGVTSQIIQSISELNPLVEKISISLTDESSEYTENLKHLKHLHALKSLEMDGRNLSISPVINELVAADVPLECLKISSFVADKEFVKGIAKLKRLKDLQLLFGAHLKASDVLKIVSQLDELTGLCIDCTELTGNVLADIVRSAPKLRSFELFPFNGNEGVILDVLSFTEICTVIAARRKSISLVLKMKKWSTNVPNEILLTNQHLIKMSFS